MPYRVLFYSSTLYYLAILMTLFETERLFVRRFTSMDAECFFLLNSDVRVMQFIRPVKNRKESDAFLAENLNFYLDTSSLGRFAVVEKATGNFVGTFSFLYLSGESDFHLGYALLPAAWGEGFATELVRSGIIYFFSHNHKKEVFAITDTENRASRNVLLKSGFQKKGQTLEHGQMLDLFVISREACLAGRLESK